MNIIFMSILLIIGIIGHAINRWCDYVLSVYPNGRITLDTMKDVNDESKMAHLMKGIDPDILFKSAMYGVIAIFMELMGYISIAYYIFQYNKVFGIILFISASFFAVLGTGHHVKYALGVWMFVKDGCSNNSYQLFHELYNRFPFTKVCYVGYVLYIVILIIAIVTGITPLPLWALIFTVLPIFIAMAPLRIIGTLHISAIITFIGWIFLIAIY